MPKKRSTAWRRNAPRTTVASALIVQNYEARVTNISMGYELVAQSEKLADEMELDLDVEISGLCKLPARLRAVMTETDIEQNPVAALQKSMWDFLGIRGCDSVPDDGLVEIPIPTSSMAGWCFEDSFPTTTGNVSDNLEVAIPEWKHGIATESPPSVRLHNAVSPDLAMCGTNSLESADLCKDMVALGGPCNPQHVVKDGMCAFPDRRAAKKDGQRCVPSEAPCQTETGTIAGHVQFPQGLLTDDHAPLVDPTQQCLAISALQPPGSPRQCDVPSLDAAECQNREALTEKLVSETIGHDVGQAVDVDPEFADCNAEDQEHFAQQPRRSSGNTFFFETKCSI